MRQIIIFLIFLPLTVPCFSQPQAQGQNQTEETLTISAIKYVIGDERGVWKENSAPDKTENPVISVETVLSYTGLKPGKRISAQGFEREILHTKKRLEGSGLFYGVEVYAAPPARYPDRRTVVIKVQPGMRYRYMGGPAFASFGMLALGGGRNALYLDAGYNRGRISYTDANVSGKPYIASVEALYANAALDRPFDKAEHKASFSVGAGCRINPDVTFKTRLSQNVRTAADDTGNRDTQWWTSVSPSLSWDFRSEKFIEGNCTGTANVFMPNNAKSADTGENPSYLVTSENSAEFNFNPLSLRQSADLFWALSMLPQGERIAPETFVRIPVDGESGESSSWAFAKSEIDLCVYRKSFMQIFQLQGDFVAFHDIAAEAPAGSHPENIRLTPGFGAGIRIRFDVPVFITLNLSYAWDYDGNTRFYISAVGDE